MSIQQHPVIEHRINHGLVGAKWLATGPCVARRSINFQSAGFRHHLQVVGIEQRIGKRTLQLGELGVCGSRLELALELVAHLLKG